METIEEQLARVQKQVEAGQARKAAEAKAKTPVPQTNPAQQPTTPSVPAVIPATNTQPVQADLFVAKEVLRPELNFAKFADFIFISPYSKKAKEKRVKTWMQDVGDGEVMPASLTIEPLQDHITPTTTTYKYFLALIQIWEQQGKPIDGKIMFSSRDIASILNLKYSGTVSEQLEKHLAILDSAKFTWEWGFRDGKSPDDRKALVQRMNILTNSTFIKARMRRKKEKFTQLHTVQFHEYIVQNLLAGVTKPVNFQTIVSIRNNIAAALYTHLDIVLSNKTIWERTATNLIREDLHLDGGRYDSRRTRKAKLEEWIEILQDKDLSHGKLKLRILKTADDSDWKLQAQRIPKKKKKRLRGSPKTPPEAREMLLEDIDRVIGGRDTHQGLYETFMDFYEPALIFQALSEYKADVSDAREPRRVFTAILHRIAHQHGREWIKDCGPKCKYRPENDMFS